jgi:hypothetical protein
MEHQEGCYLLGRRSVFGGPADWKSALRVGDVVVGGDGGFKDAPRLAHLPSSTTCFVPIHLALMSKTWNHFCRNDAVGSGQDSRIGCPLAGASAAERMLWILNL